MVYTLKLYITCYLPSLLVYGDVLTSIFPVDIDTNNTMTIAHLKENIMEKINVPGNAKAKDITLWKVNILYDDNTEHVVVRMYDDSFKHSGL